MRMLRWVIVKRIIVGKQLFKRHETVETERAQNKLLTRGPKSGLGGSSSSLSLNPTSTAIPLNGLGSRDARCYCTHMAPLGRSVMTLSTA
jgi:hypothetical protein